MSFVYETVRPGDGKHYAHNGDVVSVHYTTSLPDGRIFDTSKTANRSPLMFIVGSGTVIQAWDEVLPKMTLGQSVKITTSSETAYGPRGLPPAIPPSATIKFEVELVDIKN